MPSKEPYERFIALLFIIGIIIILFALLVGFGILDIF